MDKESSKRVFREKRITQISSPEDLNEYIKVSSAGIWITFSAIIIFLIGAIIWGIFGSIYAYQSGTVQVTNTRAKVSYMRTDETENPKSIELDGAYYSLTGSDSKVEEPALGDGMVTIDVTQPIPLPDGTYDCQVVVQEYRPISFILN